MKIRSGFVSNSSSSSFVILGIKVPSEKFEELGGYEKFEDDFYANWPEGEDFAILGERISSWSEGEGGIGSKSFEELVAIEAQIREKLRTALPAGYPIKVELIYGESYG